MFLKKALSISSDFSHLMNIIIFPSIVIFMSFNWINTSIHSPGGICGKIKCFWESKKKKSRIQSVVQCRITLWKYFIDSGLCFFFQHDKQNPDESVFKMFQLR